MIEVKPGYYVNPLTIERITSHKTRIEIRSRTTYGIDIAAEDYTSCLSWYRRHFGIGACEGLNDLCEAIAKACEKKIKELNGGQNNEAKIP
jgi:hypothetical protein